MGEKVTYRIAAAAAPFVGADKPRQDRLRAASGEVPLPPRDLVLLLYFLCHDQDAEVKRAAVTTLRGLGEAALREVLQDDALHPRLLDALVQLHGSKEGLAPLFAGHPMLTEKGAAFLAARQEGAPARHHSARAAAAPAESSEAEEPPEEDEDAPIDEEEYQTKYQMSQTMGVSEKIKMAMTGDKEWRTILIKDNNKLVSGAAIKNPRMTEAEVLAIAKSAVQNDEIMRVICANKEWIKNYQIRKALVENHKTPLPNALRFVSTLSEKDLASLAKSKNVNTAIAGQARKIVVSKKDSR